MNVLFWKRFIGALTIAFVSLALTRLVFYVNLLSYFQSPTSELLEVFITGIRFDAVSITYLLGLFFIALPFIRTKKSALIAKIFFLGMLASMNLLNCIDAEFFKFTARRSTSDLFEYAFLSDDLFNLAPNLLGYFWYLLAAFTLVSILTLLSYNRLFKEFGEDSNDKSFVVKSIIIAALLVLAARGGFQPIPITIINASDISNSRLSPVVLSTPFTILKTIGKPILRKYDFDKEELADLSPIVQPQINSKTGIYKGQNVVILILESFANEYIGSLNGLPTGYTPFLDSLMGRSLVFENGFANGHRSIEGIPAVTASIPTIMYEPFTTSRYAGNKITSLANVLETKGYYSAFMHGGNKNSMNFESFANQAGYDLYYDRDEYPFPDKHYDGYWGIYDHLFLKQCVKEFSSFQKPFFTTIFTLSSHYPYSLPSEYQNVFPKGTLPIHESVGYSDAALRQFFQEASKTEWFNSTLFVLTADHTSISDHLEFQTQVGSLRIPFILFHPSDSTLSGRAAQLVQQTDIQPTILDLLGYEKPFFSFGSSAFNPSSDRYAIAFKNDQHQMLLDNRIIGFDDGEIRFRHVIEGNQLREPTLNGTSEEDWMKSERLIKTYLQNYSRALIGNKMTFETWKEEE